MKWIVPVLLLLVTLLSIYTLTRVQRVEANSKVQFRLIAATR